MTSLTVYPPVVVLFSTCASDAGIRAGIVKAELASQPWALT